MNLYPKGDDFITTYDRLKRKYMRDIGERVQSFDNRTLYRGFAQLLHFENSKGHYLEDTQQFIPKRYLFVDWLQGSIKDEFLEFVTNNFEGKSKIPFNFSKNMKVDQERLVKQVIDDLPLGDREGEISEIMDFMDGLVTQTYS